MRLRIVSSLLGLAMSLAGCAHFESDEQWSASTTVRVGDEATDAPLAPAQIAWDAPTVVRVSVQPPPVAEGEGPYLLDTGDKLRIFIYGQPNLSRIYTVDHAGLIAVPLAGSVRARGMTTYDLERTLRARLGTQYVKDPQVTVDVAQNRPFFILGEVKLAGQYAYVSGMTVQSAVAIAGGYSERANERKIQITRRINGFVERMDVPDDFVVMPGDTLYVYERYF